MVDLVEVADPEKSKVDNVAVSSGCFVQALLFTNELMCIADHGEPVVHRRIRCVRRGIRPLRV